MASLEQQVRDILLAAHIEGAQSFTPGDLVEAANLLGEMLDDAFNRGVQNGLSDD